MPSVINATTANGVTVQGDNSGSLQLATNNGTTAVTITTGQNVGIGTTSPSSGISSTQTVLEIANSNVAALALNNTAGKKYTMFSNVGSALVFYDVTSDTERMRIDSGGNIIFGGGIANSVGNSTWNDNGNGVYLIQNGDNITSGFTYQIFQRNSSGIGSISYNGTGVNFNTTSDYRLKEDIEPMVNALATVAQLKPCTYKWKENGSDGQGFIAHELAEVIPDCVTGEKDAVETYTDEDGNEQTRIKPQGVDTSFLVATLTAAIQELNEKVEAQAVRIAELEGAK